MRTVNGVVNQMSLERRDQLVERIVQTQPQLGGFVRPMSHDMLAGNWDLLAYSFERGFEVMWDRAQSDSSGLLLRPLLMLWRQSVELAIKAGIIDIAGEITGKPGHDLLKLFDLLLAARAELGFVDDDDLAREVRSMTAMVQSFDPFADRFRYPTSKGGKPFDGVAADLDELYQAHWIITTWCDGAASEVSETRNAG